MLRFVSKNLRQKRSHGFIFSLKPLALSLFFFILCLLNSNSAFAGSASLAWNAPTERVDGTPVSVNEIKGYNIHYGTASGNYTLTQPINGNVTTYTFTNLTNGVNYYFAVSAIDTADKESGYSTELCKTIGTTTTTCSTGGDTQAPTIPAGLSAQAISSSQINLSWTASTDNVGVTGYRIYRCLGSNCTPTTQIATSATNSYSNTGLSASTAYTYRVSAYDAAGNVSSQSGSASATTSSGGGGGDTQAPTVPSGLSGQAISSSQINLSWTASTDNVGVTGYRIYRDSALIDTSATNSYSDTGLTASTTYTYTVSAYDAAGNASSQSSSASATTLSNSSSNNNLSANSAGDSEISGGGCGFVKGDNNGKGPRAKGQGLTLMIMLILMLAGIALAKKVSLLKNSAQYKV